MTIRERNSPEYHNAHLAFAAAQIVEAAANREPILGLLRAYREDVERAAADQAADVGAVDLRVALVRVMAHSDPLPGPGTDEAWDAALALLSEEDKRQVFGS